MGLALVLAGTVAVSAACGSSGTAGSADAAGGGEAASSGPATVTVASKGGDVEVPVEPQRVVALDNTSYETLLAFGVTPVAAPKDLLPDEVKPWQDDPGILDVGTHREPKLEVIDEARPDLIIGGKRFTAVTKDLAKIATVIDIAPVAHEPGYVDALKRQTSTLGEIFGEKTKADELNAALDEAVAAAAAKSNGQTVFLANHNGGKIDNAAVRTGALLQPLDLKDVFATTNTDNPEAIHNDSGLAPETVAQANPDLMIVMDRDAAAANGASFTPAKRTVEAQKAWAQTKFVKNDQILYLEPEFYYTEGIQAYTDAYTQLAALLPDN